MQENLVPRFASQLLVLLPDGTQVTLPCFQLPSRDAIYRGSGKSGFRNLGRKSEIKE